MNSCAGETAWIIGAGDGIGRALAATLNKLGASLILSGRNEQTLAATNAAAGGIHRVLPVDVAKPETLESAVRQLEAAGVRTARIIFLAGQYQPMSLDALDLPATRAILETNLLGAFHAVAVLVPYLTRHGGGQFALCGSLAGYRGLPNGQPYAASKAGIVSLAESLRLEAGPAIDVRLISPGFVRTRLTDKNSFHMPALLEPDDAARRIAEGLRGSAFEIHFPRRLSWPLKFLAVLPRFLYFRIVKQ